MLWSITYGRHNNFVYEIYYQIYTVSALLRCDCYLCHTYLVAVNCPLEAAINYVNRFKSGVNVIFCLPIDNIIKHSTYCNITFLTYFVW